MQEAVERVTVDESVGRYCVALATATRSHPHVLMGSSPRGSLGLLLAAARVRGHRRPRLRDARGRQGRRRTGARPPHHGQAGDVDEPGVGSDRRRRRCSSSVPRPRRAGARRADPAVTAAGDVRTRDGPWRPTVAYFRAAVGAVALIACALIWRRPDLLVIATPFAVVTAWSVLTRPKSAPTFDDRLGHPTIREGDATDLARRGAPASPRLDLAVAVLDDAPWVDTRPASGVVTACADRRRRRTSRSACDRRDGGTRPVERVHVVAATPVGRRFAGRRSPTRHPLTTLPLPGDVRRRRDRPPVRRADRTAPIGPLGRGQRVRRHPTVPSPATACGGSTGRDRPARTELQVNSTWADLDTHIALVVDATDDFGVSEGIDGLASSLDGAVRAAGAIAEHYAPRGERVSLRTFGTDDDRIRCRRGPDAPNSVASSTRWPGCGRPTPADGHRAPAAQTRRSTAVRSR